MMYAIAPLGPPRFDFTGLPSLPRPCSHVLPDEWERVNSLHKKVNKYTTRYRSFTVFARKMLTDGEIRVTEIRPLTDPEPLAREIGRIGVNVNQIAHWANANEHITAEQVAELRASFDRIERLLGDLFANKRTAGKDV